MNLRMTRASHGAISTVLNSCWCLLTCSFITNTCTPLHFTVWITHNCALAVANWCRVFLIAGDQKKGRFAALTRSSLICWENNRTNNKTMDPSPANNRAAWYQGPKKLEVVKSCVVSVRKGGANNKNISEKNPCYDQRGNKQRLCTFWIRYIPLGCALHVIQAWSSTPRNEQRHWQFHFRFFNIFCFLICKRKLERFG